MRQQQVSVRAQLLALGFLLLLVALLAPSGCATNAVTPLEGGADVAPNPCGPGTAKQCGDTCVDTQVDPNNCGDCGKVCGSDQVCSHGTCAVVCGGGSSRCGSFCVDLKADPKNCGGCGTQCKTGEVCNKAACALTCQSGLTDCSGGCVDTTSDDANCGGCGQACAPGKTCVNSTCQATCQPGFKSCSDGTDGGTTCVDTSNDPNNCGDCGKPCQTGYFCSNGQCGLKCAGGTTLCNNACVDESIDASHCGGCNTACGVGNVCSGAHCCPTSTPFYCAAESKCDSLVNCILKSGGGITAGQYHTCALNGSGALRCWGYNSDGELGNSSNTSSSSPVTPTGLTTGVTAVAAWYYGTCATLASGGMDCWGSNFYGQLGNNQTTASNLPVAVSGITTAVLPSGGGYYGANCVLLKSGGVDCWGYDEYGEIGLGSVTYTQYATPQTSLVTGAISIAGSPLNFEGNTCAVTASGSVVCWGYGPYSLGDGTTYTSGTPITVKNISNAAAVSNGEENTCVVMKDGTMKCWGYGVYGQNGDGTTTTTYNPSATTIATITGITQSCSGVYHTCAITAGGAVKCVGYNAYGQLGNGSTANSSSWVTPIASGAVSVACGYYHTCALLANGQAQCWGYNTYGQLGDGTTTNRSSPVTVTGF